MVASLAAVNLQKWVDDTVSTSTDGIWQEADHGAAHNSDDRMVPPLVSVDDESGRCGGQIQSPEALNRTKGQVLAQTTHLRGEAHAVISPVCAWISDGGWK